MEPAQPAPTPSAHLNPRIRAFLLRPLFAALATIDPDGTPRQAVIWYRLEDDDRILINSRIGRRWPSNLRRGSRVSLAVIGTNGYAWVGLTGRVETVIEGDRAREDIIALAWRYHPDGPDEADLASYRAFPRVTFRIAIDGVHDHLED